MLLSFYVFLESTVGVFGNEGKGESKMKKTMKKVSMFLVAICLLGTLAGCSKFDASAYVKAILDNSYKNDSTAFVEQGIGTAEEAAALYKEGIDAEMNAMSTVSLSEELQAEYRKFYEDMFANVKYTVGEATEVDDSTIEVPITYERMNLFGTAMTTYEAKAGELIVQWSEAALTGTAPSEAEMTDLLFAALFESMQEGFANATYSEPATTTIKVELVDNIWTPNQEDLYNLELLLFDFDALTSVEE